MSRLYTKRRIANADEIEFPNPGEGFDKIYEVIDSNISLRMDAQQMKQEEEKAKQRLDLLESMHSRLFWHYCRCAVQRFSA